VVRIRIRVRVRAMDGVRVMIRVKFLCKMIHLNTVALIHQKTQPYSSISISVRATVMVIVMVRVMFRARVRVEFTSLSLLPKKPLNIPVKRS